MFEVVFHNLVKERLSAHNLNIFRFYPKDFNREVQSVLDTLTIILNVAYFFLLLLLAALKLASIYFFFLLNPSLVRISKILYLFINIGSHFIRFKTFCTALFLECLSNFHFFFICFIVDFLINPTIIVYEFSKFFHTVAQEFDVIGSKQLLSIIDDIVLDRNHLFMFQLIKL